MEGRRDHVAKKQHGTRRKVLAITTSAVSFITALHRFLPSGFAPAVQLHSVLIAFSFSVAVGLGAGFFPVVRAAHLDPIDAFRYE